MVVCVALRTTAFAAETPIVAESFTNATTTSTAWTLPAAPTGTNVACLTASSNASQTPIPGCALPTPDPAGSGALRLTDAIGSEEGGVAFTQTLPTTKGLDVTFNSYQYGGSGADGIGFFLAATNPVSPAPRATSGRPAATWVTHRAPAPPASRMATSGLVSMFMATTATAISTERAVPIRRGWDHRPLFPAR